MTDAEVEVFFATLRAANPRPVTELEFSSVFELLAAVLLSAQATDVGVNKATRRLFAVAGTPQRMLALGVDGVEPLIRTIGLYRTKARNLIATCALLLERHGGQVPRDRDALQALPGVGRKTANVVLNVAFGEPHLPGGHACAARRQPHRAGAGAHAARGRSRAGAARAADLPRTRAPLADPARALCLRGSQAAVRAMQRAPLLRPRPRAKRGGLTPARERARPTMPALLKLACHVPARRPCRTRRTSRAAA